MKVASSFPRDRFPTRRGRRRFPLFPLTVYLLAVILTIWLVGRDLDGFPTVPPDADESVTVLAPVSPAGEAASPDPAGGFNQGDGQGDGARRSLGLLDLETLRGFLRQAIPLLEPVAGHSPGTSLPALLPSPREALATMVTLVAGVEPGRPLSLLQAQIPALAAITPVATGSTVQHVLLLPHPPTRQATAVPPVTNGQGGPGGAPLSNELGTNPSLGAQLAGWRYQSRDPLVIVYHTHTQESYLPAVFPNPGGHDPEEAFSADPGRNMIAVGQAFAQRLESRYGIGVVHVTQRFDAATGDGMTKIGAYDRSLAAMEALLKQYSSASILVDMHRDSARRNITAATVGEVPVARVMMVVGTNHYRDHPGWRQNLEFADILGDSMKQYFPGLFREILMKEWRYNQHLSGGALLLEMGGVDNTLAEALASAEMTADLIALLVKEGRVPSR